MRYKIKWRANGDGPLQPEMVETLDQAKARSRELLATYAEKLTIDIWNEDETWQIVSPTGVPDWCRHSSGLSGARKIVSALVADVSHQFHGY